MRAAVEGGCASTRAVAAGFEGLGVCAGSHEISRTHQPTDVEVLPDWLVDDSHRRGGRSFAGVGEQYAPGQRRVPLQVAVDLSRPGIEHDEEATSRPLELGPAILEYGLLEAIAITPDVIGDDQALAAKSTNDFFIERSPRRCIVLQAAYESRCFDRLLLGRSS